MKTSNLLDNITVSSPCPVNWDTMRGAGNVRFCSQCRQRVYNLSGMARADAEQLVAHHEGRLCVRFYRRADGKLATRDCPVGLRRLRRRLALAVSLSLGLLLALIGGALGSTTASQGRASWLRHVEPFQTFFRWLDPTPPLMGTPAIRPIGPLPPIPPPPQQENQNEE